MSFADEVREFMQSNEKEKVWDFAPNRKKTNVDRKRALQASTTARRVAPEAEVHIENFTLLRVVKS